MFSADQRQIDDRWQRFMKFQIARTRGYFADAEAGIDHLDADARWPVWSALILYRCGVPLLRERFLILRGTVGHTVLTVLGDVVHFSQRSAECKC